MQDEGEIGLYDLKEIRRQARGHLRRHWVLLVVACAVCAFLGTEFTNVMPNAQAWYDALTGQITLPDYGGVRVARNIVNDRILDDLIEDDLEAGREKAAERLEALKEETDADSVLGRQRGVLASMMNNINSGQLYMTLATAMHSMTHSGVGTAVVLIFLSAVAYAAVWIFVRNMFRAVLRRICLETRLYDVVPMTHLLHFKLVRRWGRAAMTLFLQSVLEALWTLTIVGGFIKRYSYFLTPFIVAENPDIRPREAIGLSRRMMNGHKWECFRLELSFLGWMLLGFLTFGAVDVFWTIPYRMAAYTEYYARVREEAKQKGLEGADRLNDACLFARPAEAELKRAYADVIDREDLMDGEIIDQTPRQRFFAKNFGIWLGSLIDKKVYVRQQGMRHQARVARAELYGRAYPQRLNPLWDRENAALTGKVSYLTPCTVWSLIVIFFTFCMVGWLWEVGLYLVDYGVFVNRGMLHGPWLPIYGSGVAMISVLLYRFRDRPLLEALAIVVLCGIVEYATSFVMEASTGLRWWDYTGYFLNLNGRICGEGLAVFAVGGMVAVYLLVPLIDAMTTRIRPRVLVGVCVALCLLFAGDLVYTKFVPNVGEGITEAVGEAGEPEPMTALAEQTRAD